MSSNVIFRTEGEIVKLTYDLNLNVQLCLNYSNFDQKWPYINFVQELNKS